MTSRHRAVIVTAVLVSFMQAPRCSATMLWEQLPELPDTLGFGGPVAGVHKNALIVAGGANFPGGPPWAGGDKEWHDQIYVLARDGGDTLANGWIEAGRLLTPVAYSASVSTDAGVLLIGGENDGIPSAEIYLLAWDAGTRNVRVKSVGRLPRPVSNLAAARIGQRLYVVGAGQSSGSDRLDRKYFWSVDLTNLTESGELEWDMTLPPYPGSPRHQCVVATQNDGSGREKLFLISGANPRYFSDGSPDLANFEYFTDAFKFDPIDRVWNAIADLPSIGDPRVGVDTASYAEAKWPVAAATGIGIGQSHVLVFSGSTGRYITLPVSERPAFASTVLAYHTLTDTWTEAGEMPIGVVTTTATRWDDRIVIPSGEVRPGVRTNAVQALRLESAGADFGTVNYTVLIVYLLGVMALGAFFALRTHTTNDFFRGGQRVPFIVAGLSIFATMLSSITFVALPAKAFATDWIYYAAQLTIIPVALVVNRIAIPFFRHIDATSAYEYLEKRFSYAVRLISSTQFVLFQIGRMAIVMYLPALALATITPFSVIQCVLMMGILSVVYCTLGGVEAVVWTDAVQTVVLLGGLLVAITIVVLKIDGGVPEIASVAYRDGKLRIADLDFSQTSYTTTAIWVVVLGQLFQSLYSYTSDQAVVQRYLTTKTLPDARRAMWTTAWMGVFGSVLFFMMGTALYVFYKGYPQKLDIGMHNDAIFPLFIATELPVGVAGVVVAGIFAAAQSTISTSMNSTATAIVTDFCKPLRVCQTDSGYLILARLFTGILGLGGTAMACWLVQLNETSMMDTFIKVVGLFGGAVCGLFMLGITTRRANSAGGLIGSACGIASVVLASVEGVHPFLFAMVGTMVTIVVGYAASACFARPLPQQLHGLTIHDRPAVPPC